VAGGRPHRLAEQAEESKVADGFVVAAGNADRGGVAGCHTMAGDQQFAYAGCQVGEPERRVGAASGPHVFHDLDGGRRGRVQAMGASLVHGTQQVGLRHRARARDPDGEQGRCRRPHVVGGAALGVADLRRDPRRRLARRGLSHGGFAVEHGCGTEDRRAMQAARGEQAAAHRVGSGGDRCSEGDGGLVVGPHRDGVPDGVDRPAACLLHCGVEAGSQPGGQGGDGVGRDRGGNRWQAHRTLSPIHPASSPGLSAATGIPAPTSWAATPVL
jgi:hypothetical protein